MKFGAGDIYTVEYEFSDLIAIETQNTMVVLGVSEQVYEVYRGGRLATPDEGLPSGSIVGGEELALAYSAFGGRVQSCRLTCIAC